MKFNKVEIETGAEVIVSGAAGPGITTVGTGLNTDKEYATNPDSVTTWKYNSTAEVWVPSAFVNATIVKDSSGNECKIDVAAGDTPAILTGSKGWTYAESGYGNHYFYWVDSDPDYIRMLTSHGTGVVRIHFNGVTGSATTQLLVLAWIKTISVGITYSYSVMSAYNTHAWGHPPNTTSETINPAYLVPGHVDHHAGSTKDAIGVWRSQIASNGNRMVGPRVYFDSAGILARTSRVNSDPSIYPYMWWLNAPVTGSGADKTIYGWVGNDLTHVGYPQHDAEYSLNFTGSAGLGSFYLQSNSGREQYLYKLIVLEA